MSNDPNSAEDCLHHCRGLLKKGPYGQYELAVQLIEIYALNAKLGHLEGGWIGAAGLDGPGRLGVIVKATVGQFATWLKKAPPIEPFLAWALLEGEMRQRFGEVSLALAISHLLEHADRDTLRQVLGHLVTKLDAETIALSVAAGRNRREEELQNRRATIRLVSDGTESAKPARSTPDLTVR